jgi:hypothetical protein
MFTTGLLPPKKDTHSSAMNKSSNSSPFQSKVLIRKQNIFCEDLTEIRSSIKLIILGKLETRSEGRLFHLAAENCEIR